ncbi:DUF3788 domain-containing protein [Azonexus sp.]|jgi:hypothetical protein|uniref:DUF3788 domain-containing protein n=1 Tax=Azonexus sp. TaxID=1872668 RepID=UPI00281F2B77|nr:DUF3788 domain-containing protein [Azonexus sp.]MDR1994247.1 DUF3788 domain-containing protein [Azonexus sp.]
MTELRERLTDPSSPPDDSALAAWLGDQPYQLWKELAELIERDYPGVFIPEWLFGGKKHGWSLRYKKSKSFCTFVPERGRFLLVIVLGKNERDGFESSRAKISSQTQKIYDDSTTYHDGKWLALTLQSQQSLRDALVILGIKGKPKMPNSVFDPDAQERAG